MSLDVYLRGLIHFVTYDKGDTDPEVFMNKIRSKFSQSINIEIPSNAMLVSLKQEGEMYRDFLPFVESIEAVVSTGGSCLVECKITDKLSSESVRNIFSVVDIVQRISHQYQVSDDKLKLFFIGV